MTDARLPASWLTSQRMDGLSDRAWRTWTGGLMWSNEQGTDGYIPMRSMRFLHPAGVDETILSELLIAGLWEPATDGMQVRNWVEMGQSLAEAVETLRAANRQRQRASRDKKAKAIPPAPLVTDDVTRDVTRDVGQEQDRTRTGQRQEELPPFESFEDEQTSVPATRQDRATAADSVAAPITEWHAVLPPDAVLCGVPDCLESLTEGESRGYGVCGLDDRAHRLRRGERVGA